jgi:hypothetical protein
MMKSITEASVKITKSCRERSSSNKKQGKGTFKLKQKRMNDEEWEWALSVFKPCSFNRAPAWAPDKPLSPVDNFLKASSH